MHAESQPVDAMLGSPKYSIPFPLPCLPSPHLVKGFSFHQAIEQRLGVLISYAPPLLPSPPLEGYLAMVSSYHVYIKNVSWEDDFGIPWPLPPACTRAICYEEDTR